MAHHNILNQEKFDIVTHSSAYWIGFLYADGCIFNNQIKITLQERDIEHLEKFNTFLEGNLNIRYVKSTKAYTVGFSSKYMVERLKSFGIYQNKTFSCVPPTLLEFNIDFWRGVIDGDGHLGISNGCGKDKRIRPRLELCGNYATVVGFKVFIDTQIENFINVISRHSSIYKIQSSGNKAFKIARLLYDNAEVFLDRKYNVYNEMLSKFNLKYERKEIKTV